MNALGTRKWWALGALTLAVLAVGLDGTVLSVALPTLATALHASESDLQWFSSGYLLVLAAAMLPMGLLGDRYGRKMVMVASLVLFGAGSAACALAPSAGAFIAARVLLGLAGAGIIVMALAALTVLFTKEERPRAVGIWAAANFLALPIGPILGGWLLTHYWWGWVFLLNVPVALVGLLATLALVPESRAPVRPGLDLVGIGASTAGLVGVVYGLIEAGQSGWGSASALVPLIVGLMLLMGFFLWERRLSLRPGGQPLVDLALFGSASFTWGAILAAVAALAMLGVLFTLPQFFQGVLGTDAMGSGFRLLPLIGGLVVGAIPADRVVRLVGAKITVALGFTLLAVGLILGATTGVMSSGGFVAVWMAIVGMGMGLTIGHCSLGGALRAFAGAKRGRLCSAAGPAEAGWAARSSDSGQRAQHSLPGSAAAGWPTGGHGAGHSGEPLRRNRRGLATPVGRAAGLRAQRLRGGNGCRAGGSRCHRCGWPHSGVGVHAAAVGHAGNAERRWSGHVRRSRHDCRVRAPRGSGRQPCPPSRIAV